MLDYFQYIFAFIAVIGILVTFHELGHFLVARYFDVKILRFSIGFGKTLYQRQFGADKSEFVIACIPLGGYVKMLGEGPDILTESEKSRSFREKPLLQRSCIVLAGPVFNFIFAIFAYWFIFVIGVVGPKPIIGDVVSGSPAATAGLLANAEIIAVDSRSTNTWGMLIDELLKAVVKNKPKVAFLIKDKAGQNLERSLSLADISMDDINESNLLKQLGITPYQVKVPPLIGGVVADLPAANARLQPGDQIIEMDGQQITHWQQWVVLLQQAVDRPVELVFKRDEKINKVVLMPQTRIHEDGRQIGYIGVFAKDFQFPAELLGQEHYSPIIALLKASQKTWDMSILTLQVLWRIILGQASYKNISGPIGIAVYAGDSAKNGFMPFMLFLALVSISLGVLNLLPIPLLDGGHLLLYSIEWLKGSPVHESLELAMQYIGLSLLGLLTIFVIYNDIIRFFTE